MRKSSFLRYCFLAVLFLCVLAVPFAQSQVEEKIDTKEKRDVILYRGDLVSLKVYSLTRIAISTPGVVDIVNADVDEILLVGKSLGQTQIFIWDEYGKRSVLARVMEEDLSMVKERIEQLLAAAQIEGVKLEHSAYEGKLIATGKVNKVQKEEFDKVIEGFGEFIINMVDEQGDLIQLDAQIVEMETGWTKEFGVKWTGLDSWTFGESDANFWDALRFGTYKSSDNDITAVINAAITELKGKELSRPSILVSDGEEASINVGGEVPIVESTVSDAGTTENVTYKTYGVQFSATPEIMDDDKINITLNVSLSSQGELVGDTNNFAFTTTSAQTKVLLDDGQTIIIAGLLQQSESDVVTKVPFLNRIPIIGPLLFTHTALSRTPNKEVVIILTPHLRRQKNKLKTNQEIKAAEALKAKMADEKKDAGAEFGEDGEMNEDEWAALEEKAIAVDDKKQAAGEEGVSPQEETEPATVNEEKSIDDKLSDIEKGAGQALAVNVEEGVTAVITDYAKAVQQKIADRISFPYQAKEEGWDGVVMLSLTILSDGTLNDASVKESSGHDIFDMDALNTAEIVAPFDPFPVELEMDELTISVPVAYSQEAFLIK